MPMSQNTDRVEQINCCLHRQSRKGKNYQKRIGRKAYLCELLIYILTLITIKNVTYDFVCGARCISETLDAYDEN